MADEFFTVEPLTRGTKVLLRRDGHLRPGEWATVTDRSPFTGAELIYQVTFEDGTVARWLGITCFETVLRPAAGGVQ